MEPKIDFGVPVDFNAIKDAVLFAGLVFGSSVVLAQVDYFAPTATMKESFCRANFRIAMDGFVGPGVERAKLECSQQYAQWISEIPPTESSITD